MSSHNVAIQQAVYDALHKEKRPGESFTQLFERLLALRGSLEEVRGSWRSVSDADLGLLATWRGRSRRRSR